MTWTRFMDMHSGGGLKEAPYDRIFIEAPEDEARVIFYNRFGHNPDRVTCTCCGQDYAIGEEPELWIVTAYDRNCKCNEQTFNQATKKWEPEQSYEDRPMDPDDRFYYDHNSYVPLDEYVTKPNVIVIAASDIKPEERTGHVPEQGYVWAG